MKLILLGAPGAGKGTQAEILSKLLNVPTISTGNILRAAMKNGQERLAEPDCANGYILDGVPRTIPQAEAMETMGIDVDTALSIEVDDDVIVERMSGRRTCPACGGTYHIVNNPPKTEGICDSCGAALIVRKDDAPETVKARLVTYHKETEPLKAFYEARQKLVKVDNRPSIEATTDAIREALGI